jgi:hypothetical protein
MMSKRQPTVWTEEQILANCAAGREAFRRERLDEPLSKYLEALEANRVKFGKLFDSYGAAAPWSMTPAQVAHVFRDKLGDAFRYLAAPPVSEDDLQVLAEVNSVAPTRLASEPEMAARVLEVIQRIYDPMRFPWSKARRVPTADELRVAILASAALIASQRVHTDRPNEGGKPQQKAVKDCLIGMGFTEVKRRPVHTWEDAPKRGKFCGEGKVGSRQADIVIRLFDDRLMPIECKVSNSAVNSEKRLNNDALAKAQAWHREFGSVSTVPSAVLSGVFKPARVIAAQEAGLSVFWTYRLDDLREFIESTRTA